MPQVLKETVRARIRAAALAAFARAGYRATTMSDIARQADMAVANMYRYYPNKEALFLAVVPPSVVAQFERLLVRSARAHAQLAGLSTEAAPTAASELLHFWITHRLVVVVLLARAEGSVHEGFRRRFVDRLVRISLAAIARACPGVRVAPEVRLVLRQIFENTRQMLSVVFESYADEVVIRRAVTTFRAYQVAGLAALVRDLRSGAGERRASFQR